MSFDRFCRKPGEITINDLTSGGVKFEFRKTKRDILYIHYSNVLFNTESPKSLWGCCHHLLPPAYIYLLAIVSIVSIYRKSNNQSRYTTKTMLNFKISSISSKKVQIRQGPTYLFIGQNSETSKNSMKFKIVLVIY